MIFPQSAPANLGIDQDLFGTTIEVCTVQQSGATGPSRCINAK
jgi:hypothetical protein